MAPRCGTRRSDHPEHKRRRDLAHPTKAMNDPTRTDNEFDDAAASAVTRLHAWSGADAAAAEWLSELVYAQGTLARCSMRASSPMRRCAAISRRCSARARPDDDVHYGCATLRRAQ
jgi:hypothetical protein